MSSFVVIFLVLCLAIGLVPVWLLRRRACERAQDYFVSSQAIAPDVIRNSSVAGALRMAAFAPIFALGARGDFWPAIVGSVFLALGIYLIVMLRRPMLAFLSDALGREHSITVHAFIAARHGNDPRVRLLAASLSVVALLGLIAVEACALAIFVRPLLPEGTFAGFLLIVGLLMVPAFCTLLSGNTGVMQSAQLQLGLLYLCLFGSTMFLLYLRVASFPHFPPHASLAIAFIAVCCTWLIFHRHSKYVDTTPVGSGDRRPAASRLQRFEKIINACISTIAVVIVVIVFMQFIFSGLSVSARESAAALQTGTHMSAMAFLPLMLLPLFYPICDMSNWQRLAAFEKDALPANEERAQRTAILRKVFKSYAAESGMLWLFMGMFGALAGMSVTAKGGAGATQAFMRSLAGGENIVATMTLALLLVSLFMLGLSTMSAMVSASLCTLRYDILPALRPQWMPERTPPPAERAARQRAVGVGGVLFLVVIVGFGASLRAGFSGSTLLALAFAFCCAQLSFVPLILGAMAGRERASLAGLRPAWALAILTVGTLSGAAAVVLYLASGHEPFLWAAVPACLGSGFVLFAAGRLGGAPGARGA
jgi:hypothetical protein